MACKSVYYQLQCMYKSIYTPLISSLLSFYTSFVLCMCLMFRFEKWRESFTTDEVLAVYTMDLTSWDTHVV